MGECLFLVLAVNGFHIVSVKYEVELYDLVKCLSVKIRNDSATFV